MNKYGIYHITEAPYAYAKDKNTLTLRVKTVRKDIKECIVFYKDKYFEDKPYDKKSMDCIVSTDLFDYFECNISTERNRYEYYFELRDYDNKTVFLTERGVSEKPHYPYIYPYIAIEDTYEDLKWLQEGVVYQIFPERFCNGDETINPENTMPWGDEKNLSYYSKYGGDIQGIINKVDYLSELGINIIYLTPIFKSDTAHKYNTNDYYNIDPSFGDIDKAKELVSKCHEKNIKIIFDAVFNHSGNEFFAFKDLLKNQADSKYKDWYFPDSYPVSFEKGNYYTFGKDHRNMPKFNTNNKDLREYLIGVGEYWIKEVGIDGWRLDVCDEISHDFWREFRKRIKLINKDAIIIGEIMHEGGSFLKGDQLDGIMNYPFKNALTDFFAKKTINAEQFSNILGTNRVNYINSITRQMWNLIDSHDTPRFLSECNNDIKPMKSAIAFQFTYVGVPYIYYGDEIGMNGEQDPFNRRCMIWDKEKWNFEIFDLYKKLIEIRKNNLELIYGSYKELMCQDNIIAFERNLNDKIVVIINNSDEEKTIKTGEKYVGIDLINDIKVSLELEIKLKARDIKIIKINKK